MERKQESLWWTSTHAKELEGPMVIEGAGMFWIISSVKKFDILGYRCNRSKKCEAGMETH